MDMVNAQQAVAFLELSGQLPAQPAEEREAIEAAIPLSTSRPRGRCPKSVAAGFDAAPSRPALKVNQHRSARWISWSRMLALPGGTGFGCSWALLKRKRVSLLAKSFDCLIDSRDESSQVDMVGGLSPLRPAKSLSVSSSWSAGNSARSGFGQPLGRRTRPAKLHPLRTARFRFASRKFDGQKSADQGQTRLVQRKGAADCPQWSWKVKSTKLPAFFKLKTKEGRGAFPPSLAA